MKTEHEAPLLGLLCRIKCGVPTPMMEMMVASEIDREEAKGIAMREVSQPYWCGPRQVIFIHRNGVIELWDRELLDGWTNSNLAKAG